MMLKLVLAVLVVTCAAYYGDSSSRHPSDLPDSPAPDNSFNCVTPNHVPSTVCYVPTCTTKIINHIEEELTAAFAYMYMATHFDDDRKARPGLAKFLYESASEERQHAIMMLEYLNKRGVMFNKPYSFSMNNVTELKTITASPTYDLALNLALKMEISVTNSIYNIVEACTSDFHGADFFTDPILAEQHEGIRKLQGAIQAFRDLKAGHEAGQAEAMAEFLFDKKVLAEGL